MATQRAQQRRVYSGKVPDTLIAFGLAVAAGLCTFIGWAIAASRRNWSPTVFGVVMLLAAVAMVAISGGELLPTALDSGLSWRAAIGWLAFGALVVVTLHVAAHRLDLGANRMHRSALLVAIAIGLHNIPEGAAPFGAAMLSLQAGVVTAIAVGLHNIPEGIAVAAPVLAGGGSRLRALTYTAVATGGEITGTILAVLFAGVLTDSRTAALLAIVAGIMITLSVVELAPAGVHMLRQRNSTGGDSAGNSPVDTESISSPPT